MNYVIKNASFFTFVSLFIIVYCKEEVWGGSSLFNELINFYGATIKTYASTDGAPNLIRIRAMSRWNGVRSAVKQFIKGDRPKIEHHQCLF